MKALLEPIKEIARFDELFRDLKKGTAGVTVISGWKRKVPEIY